MFTTRLKNCNVHQAMLPVLSITILFFLQGTREIIGTTYNFNLATMSMNLSVLAVSAFMSTASFPLFLRVLGPRNNALMLGLAMVSSRIILSLGPGAGAHLAASFVLVSSSLILMVCLSSDFPATHSTRETAHTILFITIIAASLDMAFRAAGGSFDISVYGFAGIRFTSLVIAAPMSALVLHGLLSRRVPEEKPLLGTGRLAGILLGLNLGIVMFLYMAFSGYPNVSAGWTGSAPATGYLLGATSLLALLSLVMSQKGRSLLESPALLVIAEVALLISFLALLAEPVGPVSAVLLPTSILPLGIILGNVLVFGISPGRKNPAWLSLFLAGFALVVLALASVLTLTWAHVPGTAFLKDKMGIITFISALGLVVLTHLLKHAGGNGAARTDVTLTMHKLPAILCVLALLCACLFPIATSDNLRNYAETQLGPITIMTYNIHQGYAMDGKLDPWMILITIREIDPDILVLQESETNRLSSMNTDMLNWLAVKLGMHVYSGPPVGDQIYGLALLSKYRIVSGQLHYLRSEEDQRVFFRCEVSIGPEILAVYGIHMGLSPRDRTSQSDELIHQLRNETLPFITAGDFNTWPNEIIYENLTAVMEDAWVLAGNEPEDPAGYTFDSEAPYERIDYIFVSGELGPLVTGCGVLRGQTGSDHLPVWATLDI